MPEAIAEKPTETLQAPAATPETTQAPVEAKPPDPSVFTDAEIAGLGIQDLMPSKSPAVDVTLKDIARVVEPPASPTAPPKEIPPVPPVTPAAPAPANNGATPPVAPEPVAKDDTVKVSQEPDLEGYLKREFEKLHQTIQKPAETPVAPTPAKPAAVEDPYEVGLEEEQKEQLSIARYAASKDARFQGLPAKFIAYYKAVDAELARVQKDAPERKLDDNDAEFQTFLRNNKPDIDSTTLRRFERMKDKEEAIKEAAALLEAKFQEKAVQERARAIESSVPLFDKHVEEIAQQQGHLEPAKELLGEKRVTAIVKKGDERYVEFMRLTDGQTQLSASNPSHIWLSSFMVEQENHFKKGPPERLTITGSNGLPRTFIGRADYVQMLNTDPAAAARHWTFTDQQIAELIAWNTALEIQHETNEFNQRLAAAGYQRQPKTNEQTKPKATEQTTPPPQPASVSTPKAGASPAPGAGVTSPIKKAPDGWSEAEWAGLQIGEKP